jgi:hypothetical protein
MSSIDTTDSTKGMIFLGVAIAAVVLLFVQYRLNRNIMREVQDAKGASMVAAEAGARANGSSAREFAQQIQGGDQRTDQED